MAQQKKEEIDRGMSLLVGLNKAKAWLRRRLKDKDL